MIKCIWENKNCSGYNKVIINVPNFFQTNLKKVKYNPNFKKNIKIKYMTPPKNKEKH